MEQGTHFYIMTLNLPGYAEITGAGTITPEEGQTEFDLYRAIRDGFVQDHPRLENADTLFWVLKPNQI